MQLPNFVQMALTPQTGLDYPRKIYINTLNQLLQHYHIYKCYKFDHHTAV